MTHRTRLGNEDGMVPPVEESSSDEEVMPRKSNVAWVDEDDEALTVNVESVARLRKLRRDASEASLTGVEYAERLRQQYVYRGLREIYRRRL